MILLDLDGVLCDFVTGALRANGIQDIDGIFDKWPPLEWDIWNLYGGTEHDFWKNIELAERTSGFWENLSPYDWKDEILNMVRAKGEFLVSTSPSLDPWCASAKVTWMRKHIGPRFCNYMIGHQKYAMANPDNILIDDNDGNVKKFREAGGRAILFPHRWNSNHRFENDRLNYLRHMLEVV